METVLSPRLREIENLHIVLWLIKDTCWVTVSRPLGMFMIIPTLAVAVYITWISRKSSSEFLHNLAVVCWITANSIWMIGEFYFDDGLRAYATIFFVLGLLAVTFYYGRRMFKPSQR